VKLRLINIDVNEHACNRSHILRPHINAIKGMYTSINMRAYNSVRVKIMKIKKRLTLKINKIEKDLERYK